MMSNHPEEKSSIGLAIGTIDVHPKFLFRFDYVDESLKSLSESIRQVGQLQPGRVVPKNDASGYLVYIGIRRFMAVKKLGIIKITSLEVPHKLAGATILYSMNCDKEFINSKEWELLESASVSNATQLAVAWSNVRLQSSSMYVCRSARIN
jgi:hypothetical protein